MATRDREWMRAYQRAWIAERRQAWIDANGPCVRCGSDKDLEVDHIDPSTKVWTPAGIWSRKAEDRESELAKCQVLCERCHAAKSAAEIAVDHGGGKSGKYKCPCGPCRQRKREYDRRWVARKRAAHGRSPAGGSLPRPQTHH